MLNAPTLISAQIVKQREFMNIILSSKLKFLKELKFIKLSEQMSNQEDAMENETRNARRRKIKKEKVSSLLLSKLSNTQLYLKNLLNLESIQKLLSSI